MDLTSLADFNAVAQYGGFGPAARALDRPKATLSRRVADLEDALGVRLIERGSRRLRLTGEGLELHERTRGLMAEIQEAGAALASGAPVPRGRLRISAPVVFSHVVLGGIAARFALAYPQVEVEVVAEDRIVDPAEDGYDMVIRINPSEDERLIGRRILSDERWVVAAPTMSIPAARASDPAHLPVPSVMSPAAAASEPYWTVRTTAGETRSLAPTPVLRLSSLLMVRDAAVAGVGAALLPKLLVERDVAAGRLVQWGVDGGPPVEIWALYRSRRLLGAKVRAFMDMLQDLLSPERRAA
ncbi:LysR substrate-binding domain-containing protein [Paraburkholderia sp.]|uniref:LysR family transcriptional regulator n=1 Tax=Paraburkholderia sp. TaxID=1926495 RepID=UPI0023A556D8|nr:LysR substrate-binding domain-containing protein [Paraburkholderia sp.]MDE1179420.1 LysR substrate-binding domain-containing protein [Paraburkholderia sp.]